MINKDVPWSMLGQTVFLRTYSNWIPNMQSVYGFNALSTNRRETWEETVNRVVNFSMSLIPAYAGPDQTMTPEFEKAALYDMLHQMRGMVSGRTMWTAGKNIPGEAHYNCAHQVIEDTRSFYDLTLLSMVGVGVGNRVTVGDGTVDNFNKKVPINGHAPVLRFITHESTGGQTKWSPMDSVEHTETFSDPGTLEIVVGDSREGWAEAVESFLKAVADEYEQIIIDLRGVRPEGTRLKTFGGYASGPQPLVDFFEKANGVIYNGPDPVWTSVKLTDIGNLVGVLVVSGGTRRTAEIFLGDDESFEHMKDVSEFDFDENYKARKNAWRFQSNNSIIFANKPTLPRLTELLETAYNTGEPGFVNEQAAILRRFDFKGLNPCAEILLGKRGFCNVTSIVLAHHFKDGQLDIEQLELTIRLLIRHSLRITLLRLSPKLSEWQKVADQDRLLGLSITSVYNALAKLGMDLRHPKDRERFGNLLSRIRNVAHAESIQYANYLRVPTPLLVTTVKPEGTQSKLSGTSEGIHAPYARYMIQRIRISKSDAVAQALIEKGVPYEPSVQANEPNTLVFSFPVHNVTPVLANELSAIEQLEVYKLFMESYVDHNASVSIYFEHEEIPAIVEWLDNNWDSYVAVSFFPKASGKYQQAPKEALSVDEFEKMYLTFPDLSDLEQVVARIEQDGFQATGLEADCDTGICPTR